MWRYLLSFSWSRLSMLPLVFRYTTFICRHVACPIRYVVLLFLSLMRLLLNTSPDGSHVPEWGSCTTLSPIQRSSSRSNVFHPTFCSSIFKLFIYRVDIHILGSSSFPLTYYPLVNDEFVGIQGFEPRAGIFVPRLTRPVI